MSQAKGRDVQTFDYHFFFHQNTASHPYDCMVVQNRSFSFLRSAAECVPAGHRLHSVAFAANSLRSSFDLPYPSSIIFIHGLAEEGLDIQDSSSALRDVVDIIRLGPRTLKPFLQQR